MSSTIIIVNGMTEVKHSDKCHVLKILASSLIPGMFHQHRQVPLLWLCFIITANVHNYRRDPPPLLKSTTTMQYFSTQTGSKRSNTRQSHFSDQPLKGIYIIDLPAKCNWIFYLQRPAHDNSATSKRNETLKASHEGARADVDEGLVATLTSTCAPVVPRGTRDLVPGPA